MRIGLGNHNLGGGLIIPEFRIRRLLVQSLQFFFTVRDVKDTPAFLPICRAILSN